MPLPFLKQFFHKFGQADLQRMGDTLLPFHRLTHLMPTNPLLCCSPENGRRDRHFCFLYLYLHINLTSFATVFITVLALLRMISGARYSGVPHRVHVLPFTFFAKPKSVTLSEQKIQITSITCRHNFFIHISTDHKRIFKMFKSFIQNGKMHN